MKKVTLAMTLLLINLFILSNIDALAAKPDQYVPYEIKDLDMEIILPNEYTVIKQDMEEDDPFLISSGLTCNEVRAFLEQNAIYLDAFAESGEFEIVITGMDSEWKDINLLDNSFLQSLLSEFGSGIEEYGGELLSSEVYDTEQKKFLKLLSTVTDEETNIWNLQYYTIHNYRSINITLRNYFGEITAEQEILMKNIINNICFFPSGIKEKVNIATGEDSFVSDSIQYEDGTAGIIFTVPYGWKEKELSEERETITAKFVPSIEDGTSILYGAFDLWENLSEEDKIQINRKDLNNEYFTTEAVQSFLDTTDVEQMFYGKSYFYKINSDAEIIQLISFDHGYIYSFEFFGDDVHYPDFEELLRSVVYSSEIPSTENSGNMQTNEQILSEDDILGFPEITEMIETTTADKKGDAVNRSFLWNNHTLLQLITIFIILVPIGLFRFAIVKKPVAPMKTIEGLILYGIPIGIVLLLVRIITGIVILSPYALPLWCLIDYIIMTTGHPRTKNIWTCIGTVCLFFQFLSWLGNKSIGVVSGTEVFNSSHLVLYAIGYFIGANILLISGVIFLLIGRKCNLNVNKPSDSINSEDSAER